MFAHLFLDSNVHKRHSKPDITRSTHAFLFFTLIDEKGKEMIKRIWNSLVFQEV